MTDLATGPGGMIPVRLERGEEVPVSLDDSDYLAPLRLVRTPPWAPFLNGTVNPWWDGEPIPMTVLEVMPSDHA